jgi:YD repeat-containing protein
MPTNTPKHIMRANQTALRSAMGMVVLIVSLVVSVGSLAADQAQYYYDELGRLVGVVNGQGDAAVYQYDAVGNLLKIDRFTTTGGNIGIFFVTPGSAIAKNPDGTPANKQVEIRGFGYTSPPSSNQVAFNGTSAAVVSGTGSALLVTVPAGATTGSMTVTNANGTATSSQPFTVLVPPIITGVEPLQVGQGVTTRGAIEGFNLNTASAVQFIQAGLTATILAGATDHTLPISITISPSVPLGTYPFSVTTPSGTAQSGAITIEVRPGHPAFTVTGVVTVKMPLDTTVPATSAPSGSSSSTSAATSVQMPIDTTVPATSAPTGASTSVSPVNSVEMP